MTEDGLVALGQARDALLARIVARLEADPRAAAAWLSGSFGRGEADAWSDLDLLVAIQDEHLDAVLAERPTLYAAVGEPVLAQDAMPSDALDGGSFQLVLFRGMVHVDWNIGPLSRARRAEASLLLFDRADVPMLALPGLGPEQRVERARVVLIFFWAMAPIAVKYVGRGETRRAASQSDLLSRSFIALWRLVHEPEGPEPWAPNVDNRPLESELAGQMATLGGAIDQAVVLGVIVDLCDEVEKLHPTLRAFGVPVPEEMPGEVRRLAALADGAIRAGALPERYR